MPQECDAVESAIHQPPSWCPKSRRQRESPPEAVWLKSALSINAAVCYRKLDERHSGVAPACDWMGKECDLEVMLRVILGENYGGEPVEMHGCTCGVVRVVAPGEVRGGAHGCLCFCETRGLPVWLCERLNENRGSGPADDVPLVLTVGRRVRIGIETCVARVAGLKPAMGASSGEFQISERLGGLHGNSRR